MKKELKKLKKKIESIEISYDYEQTYCDLLNAVNDYQNKTQSWDFEWIFEDFIDDEILQYEVEHQLKDNGVWAVRNLISDIKYDEGIYRIDAYGYGHDIDNSDLEIIKDEILDLIKEKMEEE